MIISLSENVVSTNYSLDGAVNSTLSGSGNSWSKTISVADGDHNVIFYVADSSGNIGVSSIYYFSVDTETGAPGITISSPLSGVYYSSAIQSLNISSDSPLRSVGFSVNGSSIIYMTNSSTTDWSSSYTFAAGTNIVVFYANHTSANNNQGTESSTFYIDLDNPSVDSITCTSPINNSLNVNCLFDVSDSLGLDYLVISDNSTGDFVNSSSLDLSGTNSSTAHTISSSDTSIGGFQVIAYLFDLSGRVNGTESYNVQVLDDRAPIISSPIYSPRDSDSLDPGVNVTINASVEEDYLISNVSVYYRNSSGVFSSVEMTNITSSDYTATINFGEGNWTFYINSTDAQGNINLSQNYTLEVFDDISQNITTNITLIKSFIYAQRSSANELGYITLDTTSDSTLNYNVTIFASDLILSRFNLNNTLNQTENYSAASGDVFYIPVYANLTDLTSGLYPYNVSVVSEAGSVLFERNIFVQSVEAPYFIIVFAESSSSVVRGQKNVAYAVSVTNLGTKDAQGAKLIFELPSGFSLTGGNLVRDLGNIPIEISATNSILIDVDSSITANNLTIFGSVNSSNADSTNISKVIEITDPLTITETITIPGSSGGGGGSSGSSEKKVVYNNIVQLERGETNRFEIEVFNKYSNTTLENLKISLTGFDSNYISIDPETIDSIKYNERGVFVVTLSAPSYKSYEEHDLKAVITGTVVSGQTKQSYSETQNIKLIIQEVSNESAFDNLKLAEEAINEMINAGFNVDNLESLLRLGNLDLESWKNLDAQQKALDIIKTKELAFNILQRIDQIKEEIQVKYSFENPITGKVSFVSGEIHDLLEMVLVAFERGDYALAEKRMSSLEFLLALEKKGNLYVFLYLYWPHIIFSILIIILALVILSRIFNKRRIAQRILDINKEEEYILKELGNLQISYYAGKIVAKVFDSSRVRYNNQLAKLKKERINLRNKMISLFSGEKVHMELIHERKETEREIKELQHKFYEQKKIPESVYKTQFNILLERLAEIEEEKLSLELLDVKKAGKKQRFYRINENIKNKNKMNEEEMKKKVEELLKESSSENK